VSVCVYVCVLGFVCVCVSSKCTMYRPEGRSFRFACLFVYMCVCMLVCMFVCVCVSRRKVCTNSHFVHAIARDATLQSSLKYCFLKEFPTYEHIIAEHGITYTKIALFFAMESLFLPTQYEITIQEKIRFKADRARSRI
jgi:hypothetical protein